MAPPPLDQPRPGGGDGSRAGGIGGDGQLTRPSPWFVPPAGATDAGGTPHSGQARPSRNATNFVPSPDFTRISTVRLPSFCASCDRAADVGRRGDLAARDLQDHVAGLEAVLGGDAVGLDIGDDHAVVAAARDLAGRRERQAEPRHVETALLAALGRGARLALVRQFAERHRDGLLLAACSTVSRTVAPGAMAPIWRARSRGIPNRRAVDRGDDVAGLDAGLDGGTVRLRLGDQRTFAPA